VAIVGFSVGFGVSQVGKGLLKCPQMAFICALWGFWGRWEGWLCLLPNKFIYIYGFAGRIFPVGDFEFPFKLKVVEQDIITKILIFLIKPFAEFSILH